MISLDVLFEQMGGCTKCQLSKQCNQVVVGLGNEKSPIFIVGDTSDKEADIIGEPFAGVLGSLFDKILKESKIDKNHVYFTNMVKCFPKNVKVDKSIVDSCKSWLWSELQTIKPKVVITMGLPPSKILLKLKSSDTLGEIVGKTHSVEYMDSKIIPWYSLNTLLTTSSKVKDSIQFFGKVKELANAQHS